MGGRICQLHRALRGIGLGLLVVLAGEPVTVRSTRAQVELDRVVARVGTKIVTLSDMRQSRLLQLVDDAASDEAVMRGLVDRALLLNEIARVQSLRAATDAEVLARRAVWERRLGTPEHRAALLEQAGTTEAALQPWFRDDLRIEAYLARQFGSLPEGDRARARADLITRLRQRAGL